MAWKLNYSSKQVGHIVKDCTGKTFGDLVHGMKEKNDGAAPGRKYTSEQFAPLVGYATVNSFFRSFKDYYGLPPLEWVESQAKSM
jgi:AraC-like DNA-binding protein